MFAVLLRLHSNSTNLIYSELCRELFQSRSRSYNAYILASVLQLTTVQNLVYQCRNVNLITVANIKRIINASFPTCATILIYVHPDSLKNLPLHDSLNFRLFTCDNGYVMRSQILQSCQDMPMLYLIQNRRLKCILSAYTILCACLYK